MEICAALRRSVLRLLRVSLDDAPAGAFDLVKRPANGGRGDVLAAILRIREDAADPPVRRFLRLGVVGAAALYVGQLRRGAELTPADTPVIDVDQHLSHRTLLHQLLLGVAVPLACSGGAARMESHAPAATPHP